MSLQLQAEPVLEATLSRGGQMAELFLEHSQTLTVAMDDGQVEKVLGGVDRGPGCASSSTFARPLPMVTT